MLPSHIPNDHSREHDKKYDENICNFLGNLPDIKYMNFTIKVAVIYYVRGLEYFLGN